MLATGIIQSMRTTPRIGTTLAIGCLSFITTQAKADCSVASDDHYHVCRTWPAKPELTIRADTTFVAMTEDPSGTTGDYDLALQLENTVSHAVVASYQQAALYSSDAVGFQGLRIDTGLYGINPPDRAFGLRAQYEHESSANPYSAEQLTLYVQDGKTLRPVLDGLIMQSLQGEWDSMNCTGGGHEVHRTLTLGQGRSHGFVDLRVRTEITALKAAKHGEDCGDDNGPPQVSVVTLRYNGSTYPIPDSMHSF